MDKKILLFQNDEFGAIRVIEIDGQPWFVGRDIAEALGYGNYRQAIKTNVDEDDKDVHSMDTPGGRQIMTIINESGLYSLILSSKLQTAKRFKRWVTSEILPEVRKYGTYVSDETLERILESPFFATRLFKAIAEEREKTVALRKLLNKLAPKARYYDAVLQSQNTIPVIVIAKDYGMSAVSFNLMLWDFGIQYKCGGVWMLYQRYAGNDYTRTRTYHVNEEDFSMHTYWTQKGRMFLYETLKEYGIYPLAEVASGVGNS